MSSLRHSVSHWCFEKIPLPELARAVRAAGLESIELLEPERIGVELTDEFMLDPEQSTSAIVVHHPEAKYFDIS